MEYQNRETSQTCPGRRGVDQSTHCRGLPIKLHTHLEAYEKMITQYHIWMILRSRVLSVQNWDIAAYCSSLWIVARVNSTYHEFQALPPFVESAETRMPSIRETRMPSIRGMVLRKEKKPTIKKLNYKAPSSKSFFGHVSLSKSSSKCRILLDAPHC